MKTSQSFILTPKAIFAAFLSISFLLLSNNIHATFAENDSFEHHLRKRTCLPTNDNNHALHFDGINDNVLVSTPIGLIRTIEFQITSPNLKAGSICNTFLLTSRDKQSIQFNCDDISTLSIRNLSQLRTDHTFDSKAHHITIVASNGSQYDQIYVDGILVPSFFNGPGRGPNIFDVETFSLGEGWNDQVGFKLDEFRLWSAIRSPSQIAENAHKQLSPTDTAGLKVYYGFNQGVANGNNASEGFVDDSRNNAGGILRNFSLSMPNYSNWVLASNEEMLEIAGPIVIGHQGDLNPAPGTMRFNSDNSDFESWNGSFWASMTAWKTGTVEDVDGNIYKTAKIGDQEWMIENLRTSNYNNGIPILYIEDTLTWNNTTSGAFCYYNNDSTYNRPYGKLYNWFAVGSGNKLCPEGWRVPSRFDWDILKNLLGNNAALFLKEIGIQHWIQSSPEVVNTTGFTALPGGYRNDNGEYFDFGSKGRYWTTSTFVDIPTDVPVNAEFQSTSSGLNSFTVEFNYGNAVRCIK